MRGAYITGKGIYWRVGFILNVGKSILISRLSEQFSQNHSAMVSEKNVKLLKYEHIIYSFSAKVCTLWIITCSFEDVGFPFMFTCIAE